VGGIVTVTPWHVRGVAPQHSAVQQPSPVSKRHRFPGEVISYAVRLYVRFLLSSRDLEEPLAMRGVLVRSETVRRWCRTLGPRFAAGLRRRRPRPGHSWHLGEVQLKISGRKCWPWRAGDQEGVVLDILEVQSRRGFGAGCPAHPTAAWVTQQARDVTWAITSAGRRPTILLHDRDGKFPPAFDAAFAAERVRVVRTPPQAPRANAVAERWVGTVRREGLDWLLVAGERHLKQVRCDYAEHSNRTRPHRALGLRAPLAWAHAQAPARRIIRRDRLSGLIREYEPVAA
jgi:hypothetical protein